LAIIHNGIIENYNSLKKELISKGYTFESDTDSEVLIQLIEDIRIKSQCSLEEAVRLALNEVIGAYAIVIMSRENPDMLIAARKGSPLVIGLGQNEFFLASDATPIIEFTNEVVYLNDYEIAVIDNNELRIITTQDVKMTPYVQTLDLELEAIRDF